MIECLVDCQTGGRFPTSFSADYDTETEEVTLSGEWGDPETGEDRVIPADQVGEVQVSVAEGDKARLIEILCEDYQIYQGG